MNFSSLPPTVTARSWLLFFMDFCQALNVDTTSESSVTGVKVDARLLDIRFYRVQHEFVVFLRKLN
ncbi:hypothetical protein ARMGADRAFT_1083826 [Armillaria gallica]|uniref:Secreted protein n=1 Tax=Armillaria gallica TaxID=47427 RepID=A0A2H3CKV0_ARMGA|nr:hypothetical protein ARMGADRAFT_1093543 [Armillaria gallica]PBK89286.1 hypothetical protein ARMGADRAFT_1083826 [Armillaria gallica]